MKRYMIRLKKTGFFSHGHGDWQCSAEEGKLYDSKGSAKKGLLYALREGKRRSKWAVETNMRWSLSFGDWSVRDARRFLDLYKKDEIKDEYEIVEFDLVEGKVHSVG